MMVRWLGSYCSRAWYGALGPKIFGVPSQKDAFSDVESSRNVEAISEKQNAFEPQVDFNEPLSFARFGSAELYYQGAVDRIIDFYPYDGSDAEYNQFYNKSLEQQANLHTHHQSQFCGNPRKSIVHHSEPKQKQT